LRRNNFAKMTWEHEYQMANWVRVPVRDGELRRSSLQVGSKTQVPFVRDLIEKAVNASKSSGNGSGSDLIVLTNSDTCFARGLSKAILSEINVHPAIASHRYDFNHRLFEFYSPSQAIRGNFYPGCDLFAFTLEWWEQNGSSFPDMLLGREGWDLVLREIIRRTGGTVWTYGMIYHEAHPSLWFSKGFKDRDPSQLHNIRLAQSFLRKHKLPLAELARI
jgi:hypothetical protein